MNDMTTETEILRSFVERLTIEEPWSSSIEGLDDECMFCHSYDRSYDFTANRSVFTHASSGCVWLEAMDYLGRPHPQHVT